MFSDYRFIKEENINQEDQRAIASSGIGAPKERHSRSITFISTMPTLILLRKSVPNILMTLFVIDVESLQATLPMQGQKTPNVFSVIRNLEDVT